MKSLKDAIAMKCGIGEGANCCAFLVASGMGFQCAQRSELADALYLRAKTGQMNARRTPESDFPDCQNEGRTT